MSASISGITAMCSGTKTVPGGDTACGFANTAMQLAHQKMLPETLAAVVRDGAVSPLAREIARAARACRSLPGWPASAAT